MKQKPQVGQILYSLNVGNAARHKEQKLTPVEVMSVGRKYFVCRKLGESAWSDKQYCIDGWAENTDYSANSVLYASEQEWIEKREASILFDKMKAAFSGYRNYLSLNQLRRIDAIISEDKAV